AGPLGVELVLAAGAATELERRVDPLGDVRGLAVQGDHHAAGPAVEPVEVVVVADVADDVTDEGGDVHVGLGGDLPGHHHQPGGQQGLAGHPAVRVVGEQGVEDSVGDLVGHLVGVSLGDRLRRERGSHGISFFWPSRPITLSKMAVATACLLVNGTSTAPPAASRMVTALVSWSNPAPGAVTSLTTSRSTPLRLSLRRPRSTASPVSAANPTSTCPGGRRAASPARMSGVCSRTISGIPSSLVSFRSAGAFGR